MKYKILIPFLILLVSQTVLALPTAKITVRVIDEQGHPVEGAQTGIGLESPRESGSGVDTRGVMGVTDADGLFTERGDTTPYVTYAVQKEGYYRTSGVFSEFNEVTGIVGFRKYQPWNPVVDVVLKRIINPVPMYAVNRGSPLPGELPELPVLNQFVGYDLMVNDWVAPHGLGTHRDFLFKVDKKRAVSNRDYDIEFTLNFPNEGDGILEYNPDISKGKSWLRFPHQAPVTGYVKELIQSYESKPGTIEIGKAGDPDYETNYYFRIRSELDEDGNVIGGLYGKIHGQIELGNWAWLHRDKPYIYFNYYLNPNNNDTNIEYDPTNNLIKGVPDRLKVSQP